MFIEDFPGRKINSQFSEGSQLDYLTKFLNQTKAEAHILEPELSSKPGNGERSPWKTLPWRVWLRCKHGNGRSVENFFLSKWKAKGLSLREDTGIRHQGRLTLGDSLVSSAGASSMRSAWQRLVPDTKASACGSPLLKYSLTLESNSSWIWDHEGQLWN